MRAASTSSTSTELPARAHPGVACPLQSPPSTPLAVRADVPLPGDGGGGGARRGGGNAPSYAAAAPYTPRRSYHPASTPLGVQPLPPPPPSPPDSLAVSRGVRDSGGGARGAAGAAATHGTALPPPPPLAPPAEGVLALGATKGWCLTAAQLRDMENLRAGLLPKLHYLPPAERTRVLGALEVAYQCESPAGRDTKAVAQAVGMAEMLAGLRMDGSAIAAGTLHLAVLGGDVSPEAILAIVGEEALALLQTICKLSVLLSVLRGAGTAGGPERGERAQALVLALSSDPRAVFVQLAARVLELRLADSLDSASRRRLCKEALDLFAPLAHRLNMWSFKSELELRAFTYLYPAESKAITSQLERLRTGCRPSLEECRGRLQAALSADADLQRMCAGMQVSCRLKEPYSVHNKLQRMQRRHARHVQLVRSQGGNAAAHAPFAAAKPSVSSCPDVLGLRVRFEPRPLGRSNDDLALLRAHRGDARAAAAAREHAIAQRVVSITHATWAPVKGRLKDYISKPKPNGYRSLHTTVLWGTLRAEVQVRSEAMHQSAEYGPAAHWVYKRSGSLRARSAPALPARARAESDAPARSADSRAGRGGPGRPSGPSGPSGMSGRARSPAGPGPAPPPRAPEALSGRGSEAALRGAHVPPPPTGPDAAQAGSPTPPPPSLVSPRRASAPPPILHTAGAQASADAGGATSTPPLWGAAASSPSPGLPQGDARAGRDGAGAAPEGADSSAMLQGVQAAWLQATQECARETSAEGPSPAPAPSASSPESPGAASPLDAPQGSSAGEAGALGTAQAGTPADAAALPRTAKLVASVRDALVEHCVYVATQHGQVISLPKGSTVADAARHLHMIHDGSQAQVEARVNGKPVRWVYELQNGDLLSVVRREDVDAAAAKQAAAWTGGVGAPASSPGGSKLDSASSSSRRSALGPGVSWARKPLSAPAAGWDGAGTRESGPAPGPESRPAVRVGEASAEAEHSSTPAQGPRASAAPSGPPRAHGPGAPSAATGPPARGIAAGGASPASGCVAAPPAAAGRAPSSSSDGTQRSRVTTPLPPQPLEGDTKLEVVAGAEAVRAGARAAQQSATVPASTALPAPGASAGGGDAGEGGGAGMIPGGQRASVSSSARASDVEQAFADQASVPGATVHRSAIALGRAIARAVPSAWLAEAELKHGRIAVLALAHLLLRAALTATQTGLGPSPAGAVAALAAAQSGSGSLAGDVLAMPYTAGLWVSSPWAGWCALVGAAGLAEGLQLARATAAREVAAPDAEDACDSVSCRLAAIRAGASADASPKEEQQGGVPPPPAGEDYAWPLALVSPRSSPGDQAALRPAEGPPALEVALGRLAMVHMVFTALALGTGGASHVGGAG